jgi:hypothetical protein
MPQEGVAVAAQERLARWRLLARQGQVALERVDVFSVDDVRVDVDFHFSRS